MNPVSVLAISDFRHCHWIYLILVLFANIGEQVFKMLLNSYQPEKSVGKNPRKKKKKKNVDLSSEYLAFNR